MNTATRTLARIARIDYVNTLPFYWGWEEEMAQSDLCDVRFERGVPSALNQRLADGHLDISLISSLAYAQHPDRYVLSPALCIGARQSTQSVLLFTQRPLETLTGVPIAVSHESLSAQALLRILLQERLASASPFVTWYGDARAALGQCAAMLLIGDQALRAAKERLTPYQYDLGELWWEWQALPFCFAVWAVRRSFYDAHHALVVQLFRELKNHTIRNLRAVGHMTTQPDIATYVQQLDYFLTDDMQRGLTRFYELAAGAKLIHAVPAFTWIEDL